MRNYGEELAYWYFRLNGFFVLTDYILHSNANLRKNFVDEESNYTTDMDILAVRFPGVYEVIGGENKDWDEDLKKIISFENKITGVICEVKTGNIGDRKKVFSSNKIECAIDRLGFYNKNENKKNKEIKQIMLNNKLYEDNNYAIIKILIISNKINNKQRL